MALSITHRRGEGAAVQAGSTRGGDAGLVEEHRPMGPLWYPPGAAELMAVVFGLAAWLAGAWSGFCG